MIVDKGPDFPIDIERTLLEFGSEMWMFRYQPNHRTTRVLNSYRGEHTRWENNNFSLTVHLLRFVRVSSIKLLEYVWHQQILKGRSWQSQKCYISYVHHLERCLLCRRSTQLGNLQPFMSQSLFADVLGYVKTVLIYFALQRFVVCQTNLTSWRLSWGRYRSSGMLAQSTLPCNKYKFVTYW